MSPRELVQAIGQTEELISRCRREQGFEYVAADHATLHAGMAAADKRLPGLNEEEFVNHHGFGISTLHTGQPAQFAKGYSHAKIGFGEQNVQIFQKFSLVDQVAYNCALLEENVSACVSVTLETENLSQTGCCSRQAVERSSVRSS